MDEVTPSRTAQGAAMHRAAHQLLDSPTIFEDPLALAIIGTDVANMLRQVTDWHAMIEASDLRAFIVTRSRCSEDWLAEASERGCRQYVLLGAGLDTFAYRGPHPRLAIYEVDHPATQNWKRRRLDEAKIAIPGCVLYAPVDFEREILHEGLARAGFDFSAPAFFAWLGVTPYLPRDTITQTLSLAASMPKGSEIVFDYTQPAVNRDGLHRAFFEMLSARVAAVREPFRSFFEPAELAMLLRSLGFSRIEDLNAAALNARYFANRRDGLKLCGSGHLMRATV